MTNASRIAFLPFLAGVAGLAVVALGLTGCQMGAIQLSGALPGASSQGVALSGSVHGGQQPVYNSKIQLYAAGQPAAPTGTNPIVGGLGQGATALITPGSMTLGSVNNYYASGASGCAYVAGNTNNCTVLPSTNASGSFSITGDYSCPSASSEVYIVATGGDPTGAASSTINNQYLALMAALGPCGSLTSSTSIIINEVTTVAGVFALNQFLAAPTGTAASAYASQGGATSGIGVNIGASSGPVGGYGTSGVQTQQIGLSNAFKMVNNIADYTQGTSNPIAANTWATPYSTMTNTLADIIAACINTNPAASSTACTTLMTDTTKGGYTPADTIQAAWSMARYPENNVGGLYNLIAGTGTPFQPYLGSSTNVEFTIEVGVAPVVPTGNPLLASNQTSAWAISNPSSAAFDEYGHLWLVNMNPQSTAATTTAPNNNVFVSQIDSNGSYLSGPFNSYTAHGGYQVSNADPCALGYTHYLDYNGTSYTESVAVDLSNNVWITNQMEYTTTTGGIAGGNCASTAAFSLMRINGSNASGSGAALTTGYYANGNLEAIGVDGSNNVWAVPSSYSATGPKIGVYAANGGTFYAGTYNAYTYDDSVIIDGAGNMWTSATNACTNNGIIFETPVSSLTSPTLTAGYYLNGGTGCPASGATDAGTVTVSAAALGEPIGLAADANNGIWAADYKTSTGSGGNVLTYLLPSGTGWTSTGTQTTPGGPISATTAIMNSPTGFGLSNPYWLAVDGSNNVWVANGSSERLSSFSVTTNSSGISSIQSNFPAANGLTLPLTNVNPFIDGSAHWIGVDPSGNVWALSIQQTNGSTTQVNWATVVVGAATPVITPLALQVASGRVGQTPQ